LREDEIGKIRLPGSPDAEAAGEGATVTKKEELQDEGHKKED
jgi:hypothetical protein